MAEQKGGPRRRRRPARSRLVLRWLALGVTAVSVFLYARPLHSYLQKRAALAQRAAEVRALRAERDALQRRLSASASTASLVGEARLLGLVKSGEKLFIVEGIAAWRRAQTTIGGGGR